MEKIFLILLIEEVVAKKYLNAFATAVSKAKYYKSCECGAKGTETFEYGEPSTYPIDLEINEITLEDTYDCVDVDFYEFFEDELKSQFNDNGFIPQFIVYFYPVDKDEYDMEFYIVVGDLEQQFFVGDPLSVPDFGGMENVKLKVKIIANDNV